MMRIPAELKPLTRVASESERIEASATLLAEIWNTTFAFTVMGIMTRGCWKEIYILNDHRNRVIEILNKYPSSQHDLYFCPNTFDRPSRRTKYGLPSRCGWCDVDENELGRYDPPPNIVWETSPGRHQALWVWHKTYSATLAEQNSRAIVYKDGGDRGGWSFTKMLRVPGTVNHKAAYDKPIVRLKSYDPEPQKLPKSLRTMARAVPCERSMLTALQVDGVDRKEVMQRYRDRMDLQARTLMEASRVIYPDRSKAIFIMISDLVMRGATDAEIVAILLGNPHFLAKHGENLNMAEREVVTIRTKMEAGR